MPTTTGMRGGGFYDKHSSVQWSSIVALSDWLEAAVGELPLERYPGELSLVDFGCSEGRNSIRMMNGLSEALRRKTSTPLRALFSDLPTNDFSQFYRNLYPEGGCALKQPDVFPATVVGSMFDQLLPAASVHVATTFNSIAYLDRLPACGLSHYILANGPRAAREGVSVSEAERDAFRHQAAADLERFYAVRARELASGGKLLVATFGIGERLRECDGLVDVVNDALLDLVDAGSLARADYQRFVIPCYLRTVDELVEPIGGDYHIDRAGEVEAPVPFQQEFAESGDAAKFAREYTGAVQAFCEPLMRNTFDQPDPDAPLVAAIFNRVEQRLQAEPEKYAFHFIQTAVLLTRR